MNFCLIPDKVNEFRKALKEKDINISDLINMSTEDRTNLLKDYAGDNAKGLNTAFEEKLILKNRIQGIKNWAAKAGEVGKYSPMGKAELDKAISDYKDKQQERIFSPKENETFLNDLADKRLGVHISREVAQKVFELSSKANELKESNPKMSGVSDEYLNAKKELNSYIDSQKPLSAMKSISKNLSIIGRNNLLLNPATPIKSIEGQVINSVMDAITRRLGNVSMGTANSDLVSKANSEAWETFKKTGANTASMESLDDTHVLGKGEDFKVPNNMDDKGVLGVVEKGVRKVAQASNKVAIDWEHNVTFTKFYQKTFFDAANIVASNLAKGNESLDASEVFKDAARIEPETKEGAMVRLEAQKQAARITSTNDTVVSRLSLGAKRMLNNAVPGLGDIIVPIAKIPASIISNGIDNAGAGIPQGVIDIFKGREKIQSTDVQTRYEGMAQFSNGIQRLMRIGGTIGTAALLANSLKKEDFKQDQYGNDFVKIGNLWINTEYISAISPALSGFMKQKQSNEKSIVAKTSQYIGGALTSLKNTPGINEANNLITSITDTNYTTGIKKYASNFFNSRGEPVFISNLLKDRPINRLFFGAQGVETTQQVKNDANIAAKKTSATKKANAKAKSAK